MFFLYKIVQSLLKAKYSLRADAVSCTQKQQKENKRKNPSDLAI